MHINIGISGIYCTLPPYGQSFFIVYKDIIIFQLIQKRIVDLATPRILINFPLLPVSLEKVPRVLWKQRRPSEVSSRLRRITREEFGFVNKIPTTVGEKDPLQLQAASSNLQHISECMLQDHICRWKSPPCFVEAAQNQCSQ